jgi:hypothetical protein
MATKRATVTDEEFRGTDIVQQTENVSQLPATTDIDSLMEADAGRGTSTAREDSLVPLVVVLQSNSPQVNPRNEAYVDGAMPGDILLRGSNVIVKGEQGIRVQPCEFARDWVEWIPRDMGGGMVARHPEHEGWRAGDVPAPVPGAVPAEPKPGSRKESWRIGENELIETRYQFVIIDGSPFVIPFTSTGHQVWKEWNERRKVFKTPSGAVAPAFAYTWMMTTRLRKNKQGEWFVLQFGDPQKVTDGRDYLRGREFADMVRSGQRVAEAPIDERAADAAGDDAGVM